jgi:hypothetical protein
MNTTETQYVTSFGMFCSCDLPTYKKIKRIRHLIEKMKSKNNRFKWYWRKQVQNRVDLVRVSEEKDGKIIKTEILKKPAEEPILFSSLFEKRDRFEDFTDYERKYYPGWYGFDLNDEKAQSRYKIGYTDLYDVFMKDHCNAKQPVSSPDEVKPLSLTNEQIDKLLEDAEKYLS